MNDERVAQFIPEMYYPISKENLVDQRKMSPD